MIKFSLYFVSARGIARCLDAETGQLIWEQRLKGSYSASPLAGDGKLFLTSEQGTTTVLRPGRVYHELPMTPHELERIRTEANATSVLFWAVLGC